MFEENLREFFLSGFDGYYEVRVWEKPWFMENT